ncbi:MAG: NACHT domain-containing protein, partial [Cyanobacteria bacterium P01_F01_bin.143]
IRTDEKVFAELNKRYSDKNNSAEIVADKTGDVITPKAIRNYFAKGNGNSTQPDQKGSPSIRSNNLNALCKALLGIDYEEALDTYSFEISNDDTEALKEYKERIQRKCGQVCVLDMNHPIQLQEIYTEAHFLGSPRRRAEMQVIKVFQRSFRKTEDDYTEFQKASDVVAKNERLMILGLPGAGKSTFLKQLALYHLDKPLDGQYVIPIYLQLRTISSIKYESVYQALEKEFEDYIPRLYKQLNNILKDGQLLILFDGLDEVSSQEFDFVYSGIEELLDKYPNNRFIITCRTKSFSEYKFASFTDVELAQFSKWQIETMANRWFDSRRIELPDGSLLSGGSFLEDLYNNKAIVELAANPLILTYLLYNYEQKVGSMPRRKIIVFKQVVKIICERWDNTRRIKRRDAQEIKEINYLDDELIVQLLSFIAYQGFKEFPRKIEWSSYELCEQIRDFLDRVLEESIHPEQVLLAIEANNGLMFEDGEDRYIFRTLGLQEYFVANYLVEARQESIVQDAIEDKLFKASWSEIFPLIADRMTNSDTFLAAVDRKIKRHARNNTILTTYLTWLNETVKLLLGDSFSSAWVSLIALIDLDTSLYTRRLTRGDEVNRNPFFDLQLGIQQFNRAREKITFNTSRNAIALWLVIIEALVDEHILRLAQEIDELEILVAFREIPAYLKELLEINENTTIEGEIDRVIEEATALGDATVLQQLILRKENLPLDSVDGNDWKLWLKSFNEFMLEQFNIGQKKDFSAADYKQLEDHIYANNLLLRCVNDSSYTATRNLRHKLVENLLTLEPVA